METTRDLNPSPLDERPEAAGGPAVGQVPALASLSDEARSRLVHFIVTSTLERGVAPTAVIALYADLAGEELAVRFADRRFILREMPQEWRDIENRVLDLEDSARQRGLELVVAWRRATGVAMRGQDPLEQLARLAGMPEGRAKAQRSIFDDPEDLDTLDDVDPASLQQERLADRSPDLFDLTMAAQGKLRRFAIEERLEHGLPPAELLELYRGFELVGDQRAQQYLDRLYVDREPPPDWLDLQAEAGRAIDLAETRRQDAGRLYADVLRASPEMEPVAALRLLVERLLLLRPA